VNPGRRGARAGIVHHHPLATAVALVVVVLGIVSSPLVLDYVEYRHEKRVIASLPEDGVEGHGTTSLPRRWVYLVFGAACHPWYERTYAIDVSSPDIKEAHVEALCGLPKLISLRLHGGAVTDACVRHVIHRPELQTLGLSRTAISDKSLEVVGRLERLSQLRVNDTAIADEDMAAVARLTSLRGVYIGNTSVTDAGLRHLAGHASLVAVFAEQTLVTKEGALALKKSLPGVYVSN